MKLEIDIPSILYNDAKENRRYISVNKMEIAWKAIADGKPLEQASTTKNDLGVDCISRQEVLRLLANSIGKSNTHLQTKVLKMPSVTPQEPCDECEVTFKDDNAVSRLSVRDIIYANAYELEYPDSSSEYVVNRDELIKYLMELPPVYSKMAEPQESEG